MKNKLRITSPLLPPADEISAHISEILSSGQVTNSGHVLKSLENALCEFLGLEYISLFSSGTLALTIALKSQNLTGEVITTPFTHVSTIQALYWNNLKPVFVDINKSSLNLNTNELEKAIGPETTAILPVHVFGHPCNVKEIERIASKHNLKVIYDAAHCFGVKINDRSILNYGDLSILSLHATKVFNTIEGGAVISHDKKMKNFLDALSNSGIDKGSSLIGYGLNSKMNEVQAAFGLTSLKLVENAIANRKKSSTHYADLLKNIEGICMFELSANITYNYAYFPILIDPDVFGATVSEIQEYLSIHHVYTKRYFHPLITDSELFKNNKKYGLSSSRIVSDNILCLPLSHKLTAKEIEYIADLIVSFQNKNTT